jgi:hypothetical protein
MLFPGEDPGGSDFNGDDPISERLKGSYFRSNQRLNWEDLFSPLLKLAVKQL